MGRSARAVRNEVAVGALSLVAIGCAAAAACLALGPSAGSARLRSIGRRDARRPPPGPGPNPAAPAGLASRRSQGVAAGLAGVAVAVLLGGAAAWVAGGGAAVAAWVLLGRLEPAAVVRDQNRIAAALPLATDLLAAAMAVGSPPDRAAEAVGRAIGGPLGAVLASAASALRVGADPATAWQPLLTDPVLRPLGRALAGAISRGASPVTTLDRLADDARDHARWAAEARARSLGARAAAPLGLCFLPAFVLVGIVPLIATMGMPLLP